MRSVGKEEGGNDGRDEGSREVEEEGSAGLIRHGELQILRKSGSHATLRTALLSF